MGYTHTQLSMDRQFSRTARAMAERGYTWSLDQQGRIQVHQGDVLYQKCRDIEHFEWLLKHVDHERNHAEKLVVGGTYQIRGRGNAGWLRGFDAKGQAMVQLPGGQVLTDWPSMLFETEMAPCFFPRRMLLADGSVDPKALAECQASYKRS